MKTLLIKSKAIILIFALLVSTFMFTGCVYKYKGDYKDLYTVALNNIPAINGCIPRGEPVYDPKIEVLETDSYGRVLFSYSESYEGLTAYIMIMQYSKGDRAYYYPEDCYIFMDFGVENGKPDLASSEIIELKQINDWEQPINEFKCDSAELINKRHEKGEIKVDDTYFEKIIREYHENSGRYIHPKNTSFVSRYKLVTSDNYRRELYIVTTYFEEYTHKTETRYYFTFLVVVNPDKSYNASTVLLLEDPTNSQDDVKRIKEQNGWNTPR